MGPEGVNAVVVNTHAAYLTSWYNSVVKKSLNELCPTYGKYYGFEYAILSNVEMVTLTLSEYK